jgi:hypothetical protein
MPSRPPSSLFANVARTSLVDGWRTTEFQLPSVHIIRAGIVEPGGKRADSYPLEELDEDADALALQQLRLATRPREEPDVAICRDAGVAKTRRIMRRRLVAEAAQSARPAASS